MKQWLIGCSTLFIVVVVIFTVVVYQAYQVLYEPYTHQLGIDIAFFDTSPEDIFRKYILRDYEQSSILSEVTGIEGIEGSPNLNSGWQGPVFLRFDTSERFILELVEKEYPYGTYVQIPCNQFFKKSGQQYYPNEYPKLFAWWNPQDVISPSCFRLSLENSNEAAARYLLIDNDSNRVYFYRTFVAGSWGPE